MVRESENLSVSNVRRWTGSEGFRFPLALFFFGRLGLLASSYIGMTLVPSLYTHPEARQAVLKSHPAWDGLCRWDCGWFDYLATHGYAKAEDAKIFPLFALLGHLIEYTTGVSHIYGFLFIANVASLASYFVIYQLFRRLEGASAARWGLLLFSAYPFHFYQAAAYPESLMVLGSALALYLAMGNRHIAAGHVLGLGIMARHLTVFGGAGMLVAQIRQRGISPRRLIANKIFFGLVIPFLYVAAFAFHLKMTVGDPLAFYHSRDFGWGPSVWYSVRQIWNFESFDRHPEYFIYQPIALIPVFGTILLCTRKKWAELAANALVLMVVVLASGGVALGRYSAACWPAFLPLGIFLARRVSLQGPILSTLLVLQGIFFFLFSHQFRIL